MWGNLAPSSLFSTCTRICELTIYPEYMVLGTEPRVGLIQSMTFIPCNASPAHITLVSQFVKTFFYLFHAGFSAFPLEFLLAFPQAYSFSLFSIYHIYFYFVIFICIFYLFYSSFDFNINLHGGIFSYF